MTKTTTSESNKLASSAYIYGYIKQNVDLAEFLETEIGCSLQWLTPQTNARCVCPFPAHKDGKPSFYVNYFEESKVWVYHCFGCGAKGTIIDFVMEYYDMHSKSKAIMFLCKKYGFKDSKDLVIQCLRDIKKRVSFERKVAFANIVTSNLCRLLLRHDFDRHSQWVAKAYMKLNDALDKEDLETIEAIGYGAADRMEDREDDI